MGTIQLKNCSPIMWTTHKLPSIAHSKSLSLIFEPLLISSLLPKNWNLPDLSLKDLTLNPKVLWCQFKAVLWLIFLLLCFIPCLLICTYLWLIQDKEDVRKNSAKNQQILEISDKKTVLITGAPLTKALHLARTMGQAGHRVI